MSTEEMQENHSVEDILSIIRSQKSPKVISDELSDYHANDIADALPELTKRERLNLYRLLDVDALSEVFEYTEDNSEQYLEELDPKKAAEILGNMETDTAVDILKECKSPQKKLWLELMSPETRTSLQMLAAYDEDQIGSRMTTNFVTLKSSMGIKEAMRSVVNQAADNDNISVIYVLDEKGVYYGALDLKDLIIAREGQKLEDLISTGYPYVYADEQIDDCLSEIQDYSEESIPGLSDDNHILGVITASDVAQVVDDEMGEDYAKLGGLSAEEDLNEPLKKSVQKRLPWLVLLLGLGMLVSSVVSLFEAVVAQLTIVMIFQSMILDMSGNVGTQSLAVTIRVLMDEHLTAREKGHLVWKECRVGATNGFFLAIIALGGVGVYLMAVKHQPPAAAFAISGCIGISLIVAMIISSLVGTVIPLFFKKIGVDPAVASGPLITTVTDMVGVVCYYGLVWLLLIEMLGM